MNTNFTNFLNQLRTLAAKRRAKRNSTIRNLATILFYDARRSGAECPNPCEIEDAIRAVCAERVAN